MASGIRKEFTEVTLGELFVCAFVSGDVVNYLVIPKVNSDGKCIKCVSEDPP